jgi:Zn-dependent protease
MPGDLIDKIKRYFGFTRAEKKWLIIAILALALIAGFDDGRETFEMSYWLFNLFNMLLIVTLAVVVREAAHRIYGLWSGFRVEYKPSFHTIILGLIIAFVSMGKIVFLAPSTVVLHLLEKHRLGYFRYGLGYSTVGTVALMGPLANLALAIFFKTFTFLPNPLIEAAVFINVVFAISNMLPIPGLDGLQLFYASRFGYFFAFGAIVGMSAFLLAPAFSLLISLMGALIVGGIFCIAYFGLIEKYIAGG